MALRNVLILRKPRSGCLEGRMGADPTTRELLYTILGREAFSVKLCNLVFEMVQ